MPPPCIIQQTKLIHEQIHLQKKRLNCCMHCTTLCKCYAYASFRYIYIISMVDSGVCVRHFHVEVNKKMTHGCSISERLITISHAVSFFKEPDESAQQTERFEHQLTICTSFADDLQHWTSSSDCWDWQLLLWQDQKAFTVSQRDDYIHTSLDVLMLRKPLSEFTSEIHVWKCFFEQIWIKRRRLHTWYSSYDS